MSIRAIALALVGVSAAAFFWPRSESPVSAVNVSSATAAQETRQDTGARTYSSKQPLLASGEAGGLRDIAPSEASNRSAAPRAAAAAKLPAKEEAAVRPRMADATGKRISSTKPGDAETREQLVRDIQYELKRAGCYDGEMHGAWNSGTKHAMQTFTQRVNASLPLEQPDYVLLTLLQSQKGQACGKGCPAGQVVADGGRCLPRAIVAQQLNSARGPIASSQATTAASTFQSAQAPIAGRMGVGAPVAGASERREITQDEARRTDQAALDGRYPRTARIGEDTPLPSQADPSDRTGLDPQRLADGVVASPADLRAQAGQVRAQPPRPSRPRPYTQRGSTRQVFSNLMRNAP